MKNSTYTFRTLLAATVAFAAIAFSAQAASLSDKDKQFLAGYEKVHVALAADDLASAKAAAKDLAEEDSDIAKASSIQDARVAFEKLSNRAKMLVTGQSGYHVFHCPMLKKDWVQTSKEVSNPYGGKAMLTCGEVKS
ncbi:MAG: hypothetical protein ACR2MF_05215 [Chthoniobacterales bacterium]